MKKILLTGASGYIGGHLMNRLKENYEIIAVSGRRGLCRTLIQAVRCRTELEPMLGKVQIRASIPASRRFSVATGAREAHGCGS